MVDTEREGRGRQTDGLWQNPISRPPFPPAQCHPSVRPSVHIRELSFYGGVAFLRSVPNVFGMAERKGEIGREGEAEGRGNSLPYIHHCTVELIQVVMTFDMTT